MLVLLCIPTTCTCVSLVSYWGGGLSMYFPQGYLDPRGKLGETINYTIPKLMGRSYEVLVMEKIINKHELELCKQSTKDMMS